jgi:hypothetical protein
MELAPLLFCWVAEMSLRARRERLTKLEQAYQAAATLEEEAPHLPKSDLGMTERCIAAESDSISSHDIFGMCFDDEAFGDQPFFPNLDDTENPFAVFLAKLVEDIADVASFEGFSPTDYPIYKVCPAEARTLVGGDENLAEHILNGVARLREMPKDLRYENFTSKNEDRAAWVRTQEEKFLARMSGSPGSEVQGNTQ